MFGFLMLLQTRLGSFAHLKRDVARQVVRGGFPNGCSIMKKLEPSKVNLKFEQLNRPVLFSFFGY